MRQLRHSMGYIIYEETILSSDGMYIEDSSKKKFQEPKNRLTAALIRVTLTSLSGQRDTTLGATHDTPRSNTMNDESNGAFDVPNDFEDRAATKPPTRQFLTTTPPEECTVQNLRKVVLDTVKSNTDPI